MAIINSAGIGKSTKSQGNLTYKYVRGRTIASSRITENKSNTAKQDIARQKFAALSGFVVRQAAYIDTAFDKSKYGSSRNSFMTVNKTLLSELSYFNAYIAGEQSLFDLLSVWFGSPSVAPMAFVTHGSAAALATGKVNSSRKDYSEVTISLGAGIPLSDLSFGCYFINAAAFAIQSPKSFADAGGSGNTLTFQDLTITVQYADDTQTLVSNLVLTVSGSDEGFYIPIIQVKGKNIKLDAPLYIAGA